MAQPIWTAPNGKSGMSVIPVDESIWPCLMGNWAARFHGYVNVGVIAVVPYTDLVEEAVPRDSQYKTESSSPYDLVGTTYTSMVYPECTPCLKGD